MDRYQNLWRDIRVNGQTPELIDRHKEMSES